MVRNGASTAEAKPVSASRVDNPMPARLKAQLGTAPMLIGSHPAMVVADCRAATRDVLD